MTDAIYQKTFTISGVHEAIRHGSFYAVGLWRGREVFKSEKIWQLFSCDTYYNVCLIGKYIYK